MNEQQARAAMVMHGLSLFDRGYTCGKSGNLSVRIGDGFLVTPTDSCLGRLSAEKISKLDASGKLIAGEPASKEAQLHLAVYKSRPEANAVVHLHSTYSVAVSCLAEVDPGEMIPPITAYFVMRVGRLPLIPYFPPGDVRLAHSVGECAESSHAMLLSNHGSVVADRDLDSAVAAAEELEETAKLFLLLRKDTVRHLTAEQCKDLRRRVESIRAESVGKREVVGAI